MTHDLLLLHFLLYVIFCFLFEPDKAKEIAKIFAECELQLEKLKEDLEKANE